MSDYKESGSTVGSITKRIVTNLDKEALLFCNGAILSRSLFKKLFEAIGTRYGVGDGSTTFGIPDLRGQFLRGTDNAAGIDPDAATRTDSGGGITGDSVGTRQTTATPLHTHTQPGAGQYEATGGTKYGSNVNGQTGNMGLISGESVPVSISVKYYIRYK